jgi:hypothetical protein
MLYSDSSLSFDASAENQATPEVVMLYRRKCPARESRLEYARRLHAGMRREAEDRAMIAEAMVRK